MLILFEKLWYVKWCHLYLIGIKKVECSAKVECAAKLERRRGPIMRCFFCKVRNLKVFAFNITTLPYLQFNYQFNTIERYIQHQIDLG